MSLPPSFTLAANAEEAKYHFSPVFRLEGSVSRTPRRTKMRALLSLLSAIVPSSIIRPVAHSLDVRSTGCGTSQDFAGQTKSFTMNSSGGQRDYLLYLPVDYDAEKEQPLLVAYHGAGGSPEQIQYQTGYSGGDVNKDMIVAYPRGIKVPLICHPLP
jgi:dipeptidyl aminopeptidase/acylaminoacyl peptidase